MKNTIQVSQTMTTLYLVRHGETKDNVARIIQGQRQGELTPVGIAQMEELAVSLSEIHQQSDTSRPL